MSIDMTETKKTSIEQNYSFQGEEYTSDEWPALAARGKTAPRPLIGFHEADNYYTPNEMYVKLLVNSPIAFGTVSALMADDDDPTGKNAIGYDIDVAIHPHHGALICGAVGARAGGALRGEVEAIIQHAREDRTALHDILAEEYALKNHAIPLGVFITLMEAEREDLPDDLDLAGVSICSASEIESMPAKMIAAMDWFSELSEESDDEPFFAYGARFLATVQSLSIPGSVSYSSALKWLLTYDCI
jgi:hypothetical protein